MDSFNEEKRRLTTPSDERDCSLSGTTRPRRFDRQRQLSPLDDENPGDDRAAGMPKGSDYSGPFFIFRMSELYFLSVGYRAKKFLTSVKTF